jgi:hypothetical protein
VYGWRAELASKSLIGHTLGGNRRIDRLMVDQGGSALIVNSLALMLGSTANELTARITDFADVLR